MEEMIKLFYVCTGEIISFRHLCTVCSRWPAGADGPAKRRNAERFAGRSLAMKAADDPDEKYRQREIGV